VRLETRRPALLGTAFDELFFRFPALAGFDARDCFLVRELLGFLLHLATAAVLLRDARVFWDQAPWLRSVVAYRRVSTELVDAALESVATVTPELPTTVELLGAGPG
jgi:hypothetical protein